MNSKGYPMKKLALILVAMLGVTLTGCASNPLMRSARATSTDSADAMSQALAEAHQANQAPSAATASAVPDAVTQALLPTLAPTPAAKNKTPERFNVNASNLPVRAFFQSLVQGTDTNVVVHPDVSGNISLQLKGVTLDQVMQVVSDMYGYQIRQRGNLYRVLPGGLQTRMFHIDYLYFKRKGGSEIQVSAGQVTSVGNNSSSSGNSNFANSSSNRNNGSVASSVVGTRITTETESDFWHDVNQAVGMIVGDGQGRKVITTPDAGLLVVRAMPDELDAVQHYLESTQLIMKRQVVLEAKILEVQLSQGYQQGIDWSNMASLTDSVDANGDPKQYLATALGAKAITNPDIGGVFSASLRLGDFSTLIQLLGKQGNVQVLSSPRISTVNNQKAVIKVGSDEFFVTDIDFNNNNNVNSHR